MRTLQTILQAGLPDFYLSPLKPLKAGLKIAYVTAGTGPLEFRLPDVTIPFAPSVFGGGEAERKGLSVCTKDEASVMTLEVALRDAVLQKFPDLRWSPGIVPAGHYDATLKGKINSSTVAYYTMDNEPTTEPQKWRNLSANVAIRLGGVWVQGTTCGAMWNVTAVQHDPEASGEVNPFA